MVGHRGRQQALEPVGASLRLGERRAFVESRIVQQAISGGTINRRVTQLLEHGDTLSLC